MKVLNLYKGDILLISHDRSFINSVCNNILFLEHSSIVSISGNYDQFKEYLDIKSKTLLENKKTLKKQSNRIKTEKQRLIETRQKKLTSLSKSTIDKKDRDKKDRVNLAKLTNKDSSLDSKLNATEKKIDKNKSEQSELNIVKSYQGDIFYNNARSKNKNLLLIEKQTFISYENFQIKLPLFEINSRTKLSISGNNGAGKTTVLRFLQDKLQEKKIDFLYLEQELNKDDYDFYIRTWKELDKEDFARANQILSRLNTDTKKLLNESSFSPGEIRKLAICLSIILDKDIILLDEPTNHLDYSSIESLELALKKANIAIIFISHDQSFSNAIAKSELLLTKLDDKHSNSEYSLK